jgi:hypothetical protein
MHTVEQFPLLLPATLPPVSITSIATPLGAVAVVADPPSRVL